jgi:hypothetical protein
MKYSRANGAACGNFGMAKPAKDQKARRTAASATRKAARKWRIDRCDETKSKFGDGLNRLEQPREPEGFSQAATMPPSTGLAEGLMTQCKAAPWSTRR